MEYILVTHKYNVLKQIGEGNFGKIFKGENISTNELVAIKVEPIEANFKMLKNEAIIYQHLLHSYGMPTLKWFGKDERNYYLVITLLGKSLEHHIQQKGKFSIKLTLQIGVQVINLLKTIHDKGLIHRDIKPENIMRSEKGDIKLADLGIAKREDADFQNTMANTPLGTPYYMSPEQASDASTVDCRTDIYSLGATLYYLLTGTYPFNAKTPIQMLMKHINESLEEPAKRNPKIPQELSQIICKMMEKDREDRYQNCDELQQKLLDFEKSYTEEDFSGETLEDIKVNDTKEVYDETLAQTQDQSPVMSSTKVPEEQNT